MTSFITIQIPSFNQMVYYDIPSYPKRSDSPLSNGSDRDSVGSASTLDSHSDSPYKTFKHKATAQKADYAMKRKTELCKTYSLGLVCPYGNTCSFAHGVHELKKKTCVPSKYKTNKCREFHKTGYCRFGPRCQFLHSEKEQISQLQHWSYSSVMKTLEAASTIKSEEPVEKLLDESLNLQAYKMSRLPIFQRIAP